MPSKDVADYGMVKVTKTEFFATVGRLNVHPSIARVPYNQESGYLQWWKLPCGRVLGVSFGGTQFMESQYGVNPEFHTQHREHFRAG